MFLKRDPEYDAAQLVDAPEWQRRWWKAENGVSATALSALYGKVWALPPARLAVCPAGNA